MTARKRLIRLLTPALAVAIIACGREPAATGPGDDDSLLAVDAGVVVSADQSAYFTSDHYVISGRPFVRGNTLHVTVEYGGGCARHQFRLFASHVFLESHPVQSPIAIYHNANGDMCRAWLTREITFDLSALADAWRRAYQQRHGTILLRLRGYSEGITYDF